MTKEDDLYARYQTLTALIGVLLHDLRNPLHSATLLVEAMGTRTADIDSLRGKLRGQFGKLEGLIGEASDAIKELGLEVRAEDVKVDDLLRSAAAAAATTGTDIELVAPAPTGLLVLVDPKLAARAIGEIGAGIFERAARAGAARPGFEAAHMRLALTVDEPEPGTVRLVVGDWQRATDDAAVKAPFAIAGGGIRLALARTLTQMAGGALRMEQSPEGALRYALYLPRSV
jgi:signal transduction histidine kinase